MKLWIDDKRTPPEDFDFWAKNALGAILILVSEPVTHVAFDHDLGVSPDLKYQSGYDVACFIERLAISGMIERLSWSIQSDNPNGRRRITQAMKSAERFWDEREKK